MAGHLEDRGRTWAMVLMGGAVLAFVAMAGGVRTLREGGFSTSEVVFLRLAPGLPLLGLALWRRRQSLRVGRPRALALRIALGGAAMAAGFWSLENLRLLQHTLLFFVFQPLCVAGLAPWVLGERVGPRTRWALALGAVGAIVSLEPWRAAPFVEGASAPHPSGIGEVAAGLVALGGAVASALAHLAVRGATGTSRSSALGESAAADDPEVVVFHFTWSLTLAASMSAALDGGLRSLPAGLDGPTTLIAGTLAALGGLLGQVWMTRAYAQAEAPLLAPVQYVSIPASALTDAVLWGRAPSLALGVGASMVLGAALALRQGQRHSRPGSNTT